MVNTETKATMATDRIVSSVLETEAPFLILSSLKVSESDFSPLPAGPLVDEVVTAVVELVVAAVGLEVELVSAVVGLVVAVVGMVAGGHLKPAIRSLNEEREGSLKVKKAPLSQYILYWDIGPTAVQVGGVTLAKKASILDSQSLSALLQAVVQLV